MPNLGDINAQSIAGAISTATHGTGAGLGNLATTIVGMELVTGTGEVDRVRRLHPIGSAPRRARRSRCARNRHQGHDPVRAGVRPPRRGDDRGARRRARRLRQLHDERRARRVLLDARNPALPGEAQPPHDRTRPAAVAVRLRARQVRRRERRVRAGVPRRSSLSGAGAPARQARHVGRVRARPDRPQRSHLLQPAPRAVRRDGVRHPGRGDPGSRQTRSRPDRHALVPTTVPDRGARVGGRRHPVVDRCRSGQRVDRRPPVPRRALRVVLPGRRGDHGRLRRDARTGASSTTSRRRRCAPGTRSGISSAPSGPSSIRVGRSATSTSTACWGRPSRSPCPAHVNRPPAASRTIHLCRGDRPRRRTSAWAVASRTTHPRFYGRFEPPVLDDDATVLPPKPVDEPFVCGDARDMHTLAESSVALVVTSPPYFAGKQYEEELERDGIPSSYLEYLELLADVFADCVRVLEPGGRIAANVANLGRKPYRSLVVRRGAHPARPPRSAAARRDRVAEERRCQRIVCVGLVPQPDQPGAARRDGADHRRQQGPLRARPQDRATPRRGIAVREHDLRRGLHGADARRVAAAVRERPPGRSSGAVPGRAPREADRALHVRRRSRARPVHGERLDAGRGIPPRPALRRLRPRCRVRRARACARARRGRSRSDADAFDGASGKDVVERVLVDAGFAIEARTSG